MKYKPASKTLKKYDICERYSYSQSENKLFFDNTHITLTRKENSFLLLLIRANGSLVSYESMENTIWNGERVDDGTRRQLVHRFKQKAQNFPLELVKGSGYKLNLKTPKK
jgi:DNA-binding response OmpR family regulator